MIRVLARALALTAAVLAVGPAAALARCPRRGVHVLAHRGGATVFTLHGPHGSTTYGCLASRGRAVPLTYAPPGHTSLYRSTIRIGGRFIAYELAEFSDNPNLGTVETDSVLSVDLSRAVDARRFGVEPGFGAVPSRYTTRGGLAGSFIGQEGDDPLGSPFSVTVVLRADGAFAWLAKYGDGGMTGEVWAQHGRKLTELDSGAGVQEETLRLSADGRTLSWIDGGQRRSAPLV